MITVSEDDVQSAVDFLYNSAPKIGAAAAEVQKAHAMLRHVKALAMKACDQKAVSGQEREAYASSEYRDAIEAEFEAVKAFQTLKAQREAAAARIDCWRSANANRRNVRL